MRVRGIVGKVGATVGAIAAVTSIAAWNATAPSWATPPLSQTADAASTQRNSLWSEDYFPNATVVAHDGRTFRFYDDLIKDKIVVVNFIYTSCSNICPLVTSRLAQVKDALGDRVGRDVFFYSITIDPLLDGPDVLKSYADTYRAGPGWMFLTGAPADIDLIRHKLGERSKSKAEHRNDVKIGNDRTGEWGRDSAFSDIDLLAETILRMDPDYRKQQRAPGTLLQANTSYDLQATPGAGLFAKACSGCHTVGYGDLVGPDLKGVTERRQPDWLRRFLIEPDRMRAEHDPLAIDLDALYPGARMPNLGLSASDAEDLMAYLSRGSSRTTDAAAPQPPPND